MCVELNSLYPFQELLDLELLIIQTYFVLSDLSSNLFIVLFGAEREHKRVNVVDFGLDNMWFKLRKLLGESLELIL